MANPRRRSRALCHSGAGGWPVGLPETIFRVTAKPSATASLALASVVLALGGGRTGFPKQSWTASGRNGRFINQKRTNGQISKFGLRMADFILSRIRRLSAVKPSHFYQGLAELQLLSGSWPVASRNNFPGDGRSFRDSHGKPAPSLARAPLFWRWGLVRRASRNNFPGDGQSFCLLALASVVLALGGGRTGFPKRAMKAEGSWTASGRNGRFINQKRTSGQISQFGLRMADFILSRIRSLSPFLSRGWQNGNFIKAEPMAVLSRMAALSRLRTRPVAALAVLSIRSVQMARSVDLGCGWSISYCPAQAVYQRPGRAFLERAGKASGRFIRPASRNGRFIKASLFESFLQAPHKASSKFSFKAPRKFPSF